MYGGKKVESSALPQHKAMAGAGSSGNFGVGCFPCNSVAHPDAGMSHAHMDDGARGAPPAKGGRQAAPDHMQGAGIKDHFRRGGAL
jgi:hypothetical protein